MVRQPDWDIDSDLFGPFLREGDLLKDRDDARRSQLPAWPNKYNDPSTPASINSGKPNFVCVIHCYNIGMRFSGTIDCRLSVKGSRR